MKLRILSLNAGLLKLFGRSVPVPFVQERVLALPSQIRKTECDIAVLQEVYDHPTRRWLAESLKDIYPFAVYPRKKRNFGLENGLMTFSRFGFGRSRTFQRRSAGRDALRQQRLFGNPSSDREGGPAQYRKPPHHGWGHVSATRTSVD